MLDARLIKKARNPPMPIMTYSFFSLAVATNAFFINKYPSKGDGFKIDNFEENKNFVRGQVNDNKVSKHILFITPFILIVFGFDGTKFEECSQEFGIHLANAFAEDSLWVMAQKTN